MPSVAGRRPRRSCGPSPVASSCTRPAELARVRFGTAPKISETTPTDIPAGQGQARGVALLPDGTGGYVLDSFGGLHPFGIGGNPLPPPATGARTSRASDWARGVALMPDGTQGYVLDQTGKLYGFSIGDHARPAATRGGPVFSGDVARGVTILPTGQGGYIVDRSGAISRFAIGSARPAGRSDRGTVLAGPGHGARDRPDPSGRGRVRRRPFRWSPVLPGRRAGASGTVIEPGLAGPGPGSRARVLMSTGLE